MASTSSLPWKLIITLCILIVAVLVPALLHWGSLWRDEREYDEAVSKLNDFKRNPQDFIDLIYRSHQSHKTSRSG